MDTIFGVPMRRIKQLEDDFKKGVVVGELTQAEADALHREASKQNLLYWNAEREKAIEAENYVRLSTCDALRRHILLIITPRYIDPADNLGDFLGSILTEFERLPTEH